MKKLIVLFLLLMIFVGCEKKEDATVNNETSTIVEDEPLIDENVNTSIKEPTMFMIFGVDSRSNSYGAGTRSDTIMIVNIDHEQKQVKISSIYRDTLLYIEGRGYEKVTHAHSYGGPVFAVSTINENLDFNIEKYITVNFNSAAELVDMIGGVEQEITEEEIKHLNNYKNSINSNSPDIETAGLHLLDGTQAVAYSRIRYTEGADFKRAERQRDILMKIFEKSKTLSSLDKAHITKKMLSKINTNFDEDEVLEILYNLSEYEIADMVGYPQVFYGGLVNTYYVEVPYYLTDMASELHSYFGIEGYIPSETVVNRSEEIAGMADGPNYDIRTLYGNGE